MFRFSSASVRAIQTIRRIHLWSALLVTLAAVVLFHYSSRQAGAQGVSPFTTVSAASYSPNVAPGMIVAGFGSNVATTTQVATTIPLPTVLAGTSVKVTDSVGTERLASLFFISQFQINFQIPGDTALGTATVRVFSGATTVAQGTVEILGRAPATFTADASGSGFPAGFALRVKQNGDLVYDPLAVWDPAQNKFVAMPIDLASHNDPVFFVLFLSGGGNATTGNIRLLVGSQVITPLYYGPQGGFVGLEQLNAEIPRSLIGSGRLTITVAVTDEIVSNSTEVEVAGAAAPPGGSVQITGFSTANVLAGNEVMINGSGFAGNTTDNQVSFIDDEAKAATAQIISATSSQLRVRVPFGAGTGSVKVRAQGEDATSQGPLPVRTSISGFVENTGLQPIAGATMKVVGTNITATSNADGSFVLPDVPTGAALIEVDGGTAPVSPPFPKVTLKTIARANRDNQFSSPVTMQQSTGSSFSVGGGSPAEGVSLSVATTRQSSEGTQSTEEVNASGLLETGNVIFDLPAGNAVTFPDGSATGTITLTQVEGGRLPARLPASTFSSTIVQLTPFGTKFAPGGKLSFPNVDTFGFKAGLQARLFKLDQNPNSTTRGTFIDAGAVTLSADGQRFETAANAITEATIYFVSFSRPTATAIGYVTEYDGQPVRRAIVRARGQATFTDNNGGFVLRDIPVLSSSDLLTVEVSYQRPDGRVDRTRRSGIPLAAGGLAQITPDLVLPAQTTNRAPTIIGPSRLTMTEGETRDFDFLASDSDVGQTVQVAVSNVSFASIISKGGDLYALHLAPATRTSGDFTVVLTATDSAGASRAYKLLLTVSANDKTVPVAQSMSIITNEDTAVAVTLAATDPTGRGLTYALLSSPRSGTLSGKAPNLTYTPGANFNGADSFSYEAVTTTGVKSQVAYVNLAVRPVNDAPVLTGPSSMSVNAGQSLNLALTGSDPDVGQRLSFTVTGLPPGASFVPTTTSAQLSWTPTFEQIGSYPVSVTLTDDASPALSSTVSFTITVDAKWSKTAGPQGGAVRAMVSTGYDVYAGTEGGGIFWSSTSGRSWVQLNSGLTNPYVTALTLYGKTVIAGTDGSGAFYYNGRSWVAFNQGLPANSVIAALASNGTTILAATYAKGSSSVMSVYSASAPGQAWTKVGADFPSKVQIYDLALIEGVPVAATSDDIYRFVGKLFPAWTQTPLNPRLITGSVAYSLLVDVTTIYAGSSDAVYSSTDQGATWKIVSSGVKGLVRGLALQKTKSLFSATTQLFAGTSAGVFATDGTAAWANTNLSLPVGVSKVATTFEYALAGTSGAGVYALGRGWFESNSGFNSTRVTSLAQFNGALYAATGKITSNDSPQNTGIFISGDGGQSWKDANSGLKDLNVRALGLAGKTLFACTSSGGLFRSFDGGGTWAESNNGVPINKNLSGSPYYEINAFLNYEKAGSLFIGTSGAGVWRSTNGGDLWVEANTGLPSATLFVTSFALKGATVFAGTDGGSGVYAFDTKTSTWSASATGLPVNARISALAATSSYVFAGTFDILRGGLGLYRSTTGQSWQSASSGIPAGAFIYSIVPGVNNLFVSTSAGVFFSSNNGDSWRALNSSLSNLAATALLVNNDALFAGTDGAGVFTLLNSGQSWNDSNGGLTNTFINSIAVSGSTLYAGTLGSGVFRSFDQGQNWSSASSGLPATANVQAVAASGVNIYAGTFGDGFYRSANSGNSWAQSNTGLTNLFVNDVALNGTTVFAGTDGGVFRSTDGGVNWTAANTGLTNLRVLSLLVSGANLYAGTDGDGVFVSANNGQSWTKISTGLPGVALNINTLRFNGPTLFAGTLSGGIYRSTDNGQTWAAANTGVPSTASVFSFAVYGTKLFAATAYGVYVSENNGATWKQTNAGLLDIYTTSLSVSGTSLVAGTKTGGIFKQAMQ